MVDNMIVIREPKRFHLNFDLPKDVKKNLKHEIKFNIKRNKSLVENKIKKRLNNYCPNISMKTIFMNTRNSKSSKPQKFVLNLSQRLDSKSSSKHVVLQNVSIYYT